MDLQEVKGLKDQIKLLKAHQQVEIQCALADKSQVKGTSFVKTHFSISILFSVFAYGSHRSSSKDS
jgi:hypothetical protein